MVEYIADYLENIRESRVCPDQLSTELIDNNIIDQPIDLIDRREGDGGVYS